MKQNSLQPTHSPLPTYFVRLQKSLRLLNLVFKDFTPGMCLWELYNYDYTGRVLVKSCIKFVRLPEFVSTSLLAFPSSLFSKLEMSSLTHPSKIGIFLTRVPFSRPKIHSYTLHYSSNRHTPQTNPVRHFASRSLPDSSQQVSLGWWQRKSCPLSHVRSPSSLIYSRLWVCCLILVCGSGGVIVSKNWLRLHEGNFTERVSGWAKNLRENDPGKKKNNGEYLPDTFIQATQFIHFYSIWSLHVFSGKYCFSKC